MEVLRGLDLAVKRDDKRMEGMIELNRAHLKMKQDRLDEAEASCSQAYRLAASRGDYLNAAEALRCRGTIERRRGNCDAAHATLTLAMSLANQCEDALLSSEILRDLGKVCVARGERDKAKDAWQMARTGFLNLGASADVSDISTRLDTLR